MMSDFKSELTRLINSFSKENGSDTPDYILAEYLQGCLDVFDKAVSKRSDWYKVLDNDTPNQKDE